MRRMASPWPRGLDVSFPINMNLPLREGDRVAVRDRPWRVQGVEEVAPGQHLLKLLPAGGDGGRPLAVVTPPERVTPLLAEELRFDPAELGPVGPWVSAHRALALTAIRADALGGARYGRVALEAYQVAPVLRILSKPRPRLLIADDVGLGKTIEAGLCLLELMHRRRADRVVPMDYLKKDEVRRRAAEGAWAVRHRPRSGRPSPSAFRAGTDPGSRRSCTTCRPRGLAGSRWRTAACLRAGGAEGAGDPRERPGTGAPLPRSWTPGGRRREDMSASGAIPTWTMS
jgi:hypothetical protein